jgi:hypothetical protein
MSSGSQCKWFLVVILCFTIGFLLPRSETKAVPAKCVPDCSETQYNKFCTGPNAGIYVYWTKATCQLCGSGAGSTSCIDRNQDGMCAQSSETMKSKIIMSFEACPCQVGTTTYDYVEATPVDPGSVTGDDLTRLRCFI